jgi:hypothetical protein
MSLPKRVQLPSGRKVDLSAKEGLKPRARAERGPLFAEAIDLFESGDAQIRSDGAPLAVYALELRDFHALRAIATHAGLLAEETIEIRCKNCEAKIEVSPCAAMPLGPFVDAELDDEELDRTLELGAPHAIPEIALGRVRRAKDVTLGPLACEDALPLWRALAKDALHVTSDVVRAMGVTDLGPERNPARIARALGAASDEAFGAVTDIFLEAHYPPRLFAIALCSKCGARNDVDAPYEREFEPSAAPVRDEEATRYPELPAFEAFADRAQALAKEIFDARGAEDVVLLVEEGVPAVDEGGEPLMGAYSPGWQEGGRAPEITIYYKTFRAIWDEDGAFDWDGEVRETIDHELDHHLGFVTGDDPMDDDERAEIRSAAMRVLGKRALARESVRSFGAEALDFVRRTWLIWVILAIATVAVTMTR